MANISIFNTTQEQYFLSPSGLLSLKNRLQNLRSQRLEHIQNLKTVKDQQSDNLTIEDSSYIQELGSLQAVETEIEKNEHILAHTKLLEQKPHRKDKVEFGSRVKLKTGKKEIEYMIVHSLEADPSKGKISDKSPLGRELLGKRLRDYIMLKPLRRHKPILLKLVSIK